MTQSQWTEIRTADDFTPEIIEAIEDYAVGWPEASALDIIERFERSMLRDGTQPDFGPSTSGPVVSKVRRIVRSARMVD